MIAGIFTDAIHVTNESNVSNVIRTKCGDVCVF